MTRIALIANGEFQKDPSLVESIRSHDLLIAVDGGLRHCYAHDLPPSLHIGDMDSTEKSLMLAFPSLERIAYPADKDETDLELAITWALGKNPDSITLFGGLGHRLDHLLVNALLLCRHPEMLFLESPLERAFVLKNRPTVLPTKPGQTLSLIPLNGPARKITTRGLKWELKKGRLGKSFLGISNVAISYEVEIEVEEGDLLCILNKTQTP